MTSTEFLKKLIGELKICGIIGYLSNKKIELPPILKYKTQRSRS